MTGYPLSKVGVILLLALCLAVRGGTKVLNKGKSVVTTRAMAQTADSGRVAALDWVISRGGPGT